MYVHVVFTKMPAHALCTAGRQLLSLGGLGSLGLLSMVEGLSEEFLVHATSAGDLATVQAYLDKNPHQVCCVNEHVYILYMFLNKR